MSTKLKRYWCRESWARPKIWNSWQRWLSGFPAWNRKATLQSFRITLFLKLIVNMVPQPPPPYPNSGIFPDLPGVPIDCFFGHDKFSELFPMFSCILALLKGWAPDACKLLFCFRPRLHGFGKPHQLEVLGSGVFGDHFYLTFQKMARKLRIIILLHLW